MTTDHRKLVRYFVSYTRKDQKLPGRLLEQLKLYLNCSRSYTFQSWRDTDLALGSDWHADIQKAIYECHFGLFLVSMNFVNNRYITQHELPRFLGEGALHLNGRRRIVPVMLSPIPLDDKLDLKGLERTNIFSNNKSLSFQQCSTPLTRQEFANQLFSKITDLLDTAPDDFWRTEADGPPEQASVFILNDPARAPTRPDPPEKPTTAEAPPPVAPDPKTLASYQAIITDILEESPDARNHLATALGVTAADGTDTSADLAVRLLAVPTVDQALEVLFKAFNAFEKPHTPNRGGSPRGPGQEAIGAVAQAVIPPLYGAGPARDLKAAADRVEPLTMDIHYPMLADLIVAAHTGRPATYFPRTNENQLPIPAFGLVQPPEAGMEPEQTAKAAEAVGAPLRFAYFLDDPAEIRKRLYATFKQYFMPEEPAATDDECDAAHAKGMLDAINAAIREDMERYNFTYYIFLRWPENQRRQEDLQRLVEAIREMFPTVLCLATKAPPEQKFEERKRFRRFMLMAPIAAKAD